MTTRDAAFEEVDENKPDPYLGTVIAGDIAIESIAGTGAMGKVYRAQQRSVDRPVAVKILHRELSGNAQLVKRFHREAKIASKLQHPHVVEVHLAGQLPDGSMYIVMEFLDGKSLMAAMSEGGGTLPLSRALGITLQICDAVGEGHAIGIVHRDLKPENVMLVRRADLDDWVKVLDFGIARLHLGDQSMETAAGRIFGTARYISPEGATGAPVQAPADVYAIATMLYQMLCGRTPFDGATVGLLIKHIHEQPPPLDAQPEATGVPPEIVRVIMQNLAKDPLQRAQNARDFGSALAAAAGDAQVPIARMDAVDRLRFAPTAGVPKTIDQTVPPEIRKLTKGDKPSRAWIWLVLLAFVLGIGLAIAGMRINRDDERTAYLQRTRHALNEGHYVTPPGENVYDLVEDGLKKWPNDTELLQMRSEGEHEMITMAMAAQASGDIVGARNLARDAYKLDSTDNSARFVRAQAEDDLNAINSDAGVHVGSPRLVFESPPVVKTGAPVEMSCRVVPGSAGPKAKITVRITVFPNGQTVGGAPVTLTNADPSNVRATLTAPTVGSWDVTFEANVDGVVVRAMRDLDVTP